MSLNAYKTRGRAYKCKRCDKIARKGRLLGHIMLQHVPLDRVPFYCSLCCFRCQDSDTLVKHLKKYKRHGEAEKKLIVPLNYTRILRKSDNPMFIGEEDMIMLSREQSIQWHARHALSAEDLDTDNMFEDFESETDSRTTLPSWAQQYNPTPLKDLQQATLPTECAFQPITTSTNNLPVSSTISYPSVLSTINFSDLNSSILRTPNLPTYNPTAPTPVQDENILPTLLDVDQEDPLNIRFDFNEPQPPTKRQRVNSSKNNSQKEPSTSDISNAITEGFRKLTEAIDNNTRAIRCQGETLEKVANELERIERKIARLSRD